MLTPFNKPGRFWRGNLHTHSTRSDGQQSPEEVCRVYRAAGYDFLCVSDHFTSTNGFPITDTRPYRTDPFITLIGAELHTQQHMMELGNLWHLLAVGLPFEFAPTVPEETGSQLAQRALDAGAFVLAAHPQWFGMTDADYLSLGQIHGLEIFNATVAELNDTSDSSYMLDTLLMRGQRPFARASDDAHFDPNTCERLMGWVMIKSETLEPDALLTALKAGDYYSSTGSSIIDLQVVPGERLTVRCTPVDHIFVLGRPAEYQNVGEQGITEAEFNLADWRSPYVRVVIRDQHNRRAWSNPIWLSEE